MAHAGVVKTWKCSRGYGFITPDDGSEDIFIHVKNIVPPERKHLKIGEEVLLFFFLLILLQNYVVMKLSASAWSFG